MAGLPKSIIKRYGVTKKAWQVFRGARTSASPSRRAAKAPMAKRKKFSRKSSSGSSMTPMNAIMAGAVSGAVLGVVPSNYNTTLTRALAGYAACSYGSGIVKNAGYITLGAEAQRFTAPLAQNVAGGIFNNATSSSNTGSW